MSKKLSPNQDGFTIIELMIATTVLSVILVMVSGMMISIGRLYYKGINQSKIQSAVRNTTDDVAQNLQLSGGLRPASDPNGVKAYCIGETRYTFVIGRMLGTGLETDGTTQKAKHVLWRDAVPASGNCITANLDNPGPDGTELMPTNSRLLAFNISSLTSPYPIEIGMAYGDIDLLKIDIANNIGMSTNCLGSTGDQFCATAKLRTVAAKRITGN